MNTIHSVRRSPASLRARFAIPVRHIVDLLILAVAFQLAYELRFDFDVPPRELTRSLMQLPIVLLVQLVAVRTSGAQAFIWRYIGLTEVGTFLAAAAGSALPILLLRLGLPEPLSDFRVPLSVILMDSVFAFGGLLGARVLRRALHERDHRRKSMALVPSSGRKPILIIGACRAGMTAAREIQSHGDTPLDIKGFVDDDPRKLNSVVYGLRILGGTGDLPRLVKSLAIDHVLIAIEEASRTQLKRIMSICEEIPVKVRVIPPLSEILEGTVSINRIRDVQVEDLLGRAPVSLDEEGIGRLVAGRTVMVTGAGGSIGSELARQVGRFRPSAMLLVERAECALFTVDRLIRETHPLCPVHALVGDVGDEERMRSIITTYRPHLILHAAAHKHVWMMEMNPTEAIKNNALATHALAELAGACGVEAFVLISTDKAVRPTSIMGASKRVAELAVQSLGSRFATRYVVVRFGNVIGSAGSVLPIFREQIRAGGPITVTHPDVTRYFMTIPEAAQLVLQAAAIGSGGEIFILDMGEPVRILDLAKDTIRLSGLKPFEDIDIVYTGLRPGEKLFEELETTGEHISHTRHQQILIGDIAGLSYERVREALDQLGLLAAVGEDAAIRTFLNDILPEARLAIDAGTLTSASAVS